MTGFARLVSVVDVDDDGSDPRRMACRVLLFAELTDGRRLLLLDDRGWGSSMHGGNPDANIWAHTAREEIEETARTVVGPDEPPEGRTHEEEAALHWAALAARIASPDLAVDGPMLARATHDVELSEAVRGRLSPPV